MEAKFVFESLDLLKAKPEKEALSDLEDASQEQLMKALDRTSVVGFEDDEKRDLILSKIKDPLKQTLLNSESEVARHKEYSWDENLYDSTVLDLLGIKSKEDFMKTDLLGFSVDYTTGELELDYNFFDQFVDKKETISTYMGSRNPGIAIVWMKDGSKAIKLSGYDHEFISKKEWLKPEKTNESFDLLSSKSKDELHDGIFGNIAEEVVPFEDVEIGTTFMLGDRKLTVKAKGHPSGKVGEYFDYADEPNYEEFGLDVDEFTREVYDDDPFLSRHIVVEEEFMHDTDYVISLYTPDGIYINKDNII